MAAEIHFFIGKGGVGKSTTSALTALHLAALGKETRLVSLDPAHNLGDLFAMKFSEKPKRVCDHLDVQEIDTAAWQKRYLKDTRDHLRQTYLYQSAFNLQDHFNVLKFSPGLEEHALMLAFEAVLSQSNQPEVILFDMAPTALSLRFFSLPSVTLVWLDQLLRLREQICQKKEIISRIKIGKRDIETDRVTRKLQTLIQRHTQLRDRFVSATCHLHLVMNPDVLSQSEARRIQQRLAEIDIPISRLLINKALATDVDPTLLQGFASTQVTTLPESAYPLLGLEAFKQYLHDHPEAFGDW